MFGRKPVIPANLANADGKMPSAASPVEPIDNGTWIAAWPAEFAIIGADGEREIFPWSEFETGTWDDDSNTLSVSFVNPNNEPREFVLPREADALIISMVRERVERSIVYQQIADLPGGGIARGQVRRNADEPPFTQIIVDRDVTAADMTIIKRLENDLREAVGIPYEPTN